jgi:hypothetical protein
VGHSRTVQATTEVHLPYAYAHPPGYRFTIEYKESGKVVRTETFVNVAEKMNDGEVLQRWERIN